jgi:glycine betaine/proline transport system substrate-binding protein
MTNTRSTRAILAAGLGALLAAVAAQPLAAAEPASCKTVRFGDVGWTDIAATTGAVTAVLKGLGYETTVTISSVSIVFVGMRTKSLDVFLGNWMPTMESMVRPHIDDGSVEVVRTNLEGAKYTLAVPSYLAEAGLKDFKDIATFKDQLGGRIHGIEAGNDGNLIIDKMIKENAFGLGGYSLVESSEAGMLGEVRRAARGEKPIVFLGWEPHPMNTNLKMTYLTGGDDWFGPNLGGATVHTNVRKGYRAECPNVGKLLENAVFSLPMENEIMGAILDERQEPEAAARAWLAKNPAVAEAWLAGGVTTFDGQPAMPAVTAYLGQKG